MKKQTRNLVRTFKEPQFELSDGDESANQFQELSEGEPAPKKKVLKKTKKEKKEPLKKKAEEIESFNPNIVKVKNKLVGNVEQGDLYASDEGNNREDENLNQIEVDRDAKLDLGSGPQAPKITAGSFLAKIKKKDSEEDDLAK